MKDDEVEKLSTAIRNIKSETHTCAICFNTIDKSFDVCEICNSEKRDGGTICVVKDGKDLDAIERAGIYRGKYHVTGGLISPMAGVTQEDIRLKELVERVYAEDIKEVIIAFESNVEGTATAQYISKLLKPSEVKVTKLAQGMSVGADFSGTDSVTIAKAIENRVPM